MCGQWLPLGVSQFQRPGKQCPRSNGDNHAYARRSPDDKRVCYWPEHLCTGPCANLADNSLLVFFSRIGC